jgi:hypothetical protein
MIDVLLNKYICNVDFKVINKFITLLLIRIIRKLPIQNGKLFLF